jgi:hypothetical protein
MRLSSQRPWGAQCWCPHLNSRRRPSRETVHTRASSKSFHFSMRLAKSMRSGPLSPTSRTANARRRRYGTARSATEACPKLQPMLWLASIREAKLSLRIRRQLRLSGIKFLKCEFQHLPQSFLSSGGAQIKILSAEESRKIAANSRSDRRPARTTHDLGAAFPGCTR